MDEKNVTILIQQFSTRSDKLLNYYNSDGVTAMRLLKQFIRFIDNQPLIKDFIDKNNLTNHDIKSLIEQNKGNKFGIPEDDQEEIAFIYQLLKYVVDNFDNYVSFIPMGYAFYRGAKIKDKILDFNEEVVSCLVDRIYEYLNEVRTRMAKDQEPVRQYVFNEKVNQFNNAEKGNIDARQYNYKSEDTSELITITKDLIALIKEYEIADDETKEDALDFLEEVGGALETGQEVKPSLIRRTTQKLEDITSALSASDALALKVTKFLETISSVIPQ
ncbi:hypothetical protein P5611_015680 [Bacillus subtilis]